MSVTVVPETGGHAVRGLLKSGRTGGGGSWRRSAPQHWPAHQSLAATPALSPPAAMAPRKLTLVLLATVLAVATAGAGDSWGEVAGGRRAAWASSAQAHWPHRGSSGR